MSLCYETAEGLVGEGRGGIWASGQAGLLWFFDRGNAEVLVKVLDGCSYNGRRWVYVAPVTDVAFNLHVTSHKRTPVDSSKQAGRDGGCPGRHLHVRLRYGRRGGYGVGSLPTRCPPGRPRRLSGTERDQTLRAVAGGAGVAGSRSANRCQEPDRAGEYTDCRPTQAPLVLDGGYEVSLCYETAEGLVGEGRGGIWASGQSGLLWFFDRDNAEALVKVLDGCSHNGRRWVFVAPVTDLAFNLHVTSHNGRRWTHRNRLGMTAAARGDTSAFDCVTDDGKAGVWVAPEALTFTAAGQTAQLAATVLDESGRVVNGAAVSWWSGNPAVATVDAAGLVTAVGIGTTTVKARWGLLSGEAAVKVTGAPRVAVSPAIGAVARGDTLRLVAEAYDETGNTVEGAAFTWSSSRGSVATVDGSGLVKGVALGKVTITATLRSGGAEGGIERISGTSELTVVTAEAHDRAVLVAFYEATGGPSWRRSDGWLTDAPAGDWYGVETDQSGRVVGLDLGAVFDLEALYDFGDGLGLTGSIPPELGRLAGLKSLNLSLNRLTGSIPPELGRLARLESLNLRRNDLTGSIPPELGDLVNLRVLDLSLNNVYGGIPPELGRLAKLEELILYACGVSGSVPPNLAALPA